MHGWMHIHLGVYGGQRWTFSASPICLFVCFEVGSLTECGVHWFGYVGGTSCWDY